VIKKIKAIQVAEKAQEIDDLVAMDAKMELAVNQQVVGNFYLSPSDLEDFARGYLLDEGLLDPAQIKSIELEDSIIQVTLKEKDFQVKTGSMACYDGWVHKEEPLPMVESSFQVDKNKILKSFDHLIDQAKVWKKTGGTHVAGLVSKNSFIVREDVSRHVAVDKVIGAAYLEGVNFKKSFMVCSGRIPPDRVVKLVNVGIPIMVTKAAPTIQGLKVGEAAGLTLIGFLRDGRFNIYTHPQRILV